jgi:DNA-binding FrmR family transcriptional regulator
MTSTVAPGSGTPVAAATPGYADRRADHLARLHKVEGQVRGIARMVEQDRYCIDVLTQVSAATRALQQVALGLLDDHLRHCVVDAARQGSVERDAKLDELAETLRRAFRL